MNDHNPRKAIESGADKANSSAVSRPAQSALNGDDISPTTASEPELQPDIEQAHKGLELLDEDAEKFTFQTFDDTGQKRPELARVLNGTLDEHWDQLVELNQRGAGVFVAVNETDLKGRKRENMRGIRCVFQEDDAGAPVDFPLEPHFVVETSPGKYHRYFLCDGPHVDDAGVDVDVLSAEFRQVQERLIADFGSDPAVKDVGRVLRVPGFYHRKGDPHLVRIAEENPRLPYPWAKIKEAFPPVEPGQAQSVDAVVKDDKGFVVDGRDGFLSNLAYREVCRAIEANKQAGKPPLDIDIKHLAGHVWTLFMHRIDNERPKGMEIARYEELTATGNPIPGPFWCQEDAREKIEQKLRAAQSGNLPKHDRNGVGADTTAGGNVADHEAFVKELITQAEQDTGVPYRPENLQRLDIIRAQRLDLYEGTLAKFRDVKGIRITVLDSAVKKLAHADGDTLQGKKLALEPTEPWHELVDGAELLDKIVAIIRRFVVLPNHGAEMVALWCLFTFAIDAFRIAPRLAFLAPEKGSGKSTALSVVQQLVNKALAAANTTASPIFRVIEAHQPTLVIDEADTFLRDDSDLRGILNSGHDRPNAFVLRSAGDEHEPRQFNTFAPIAFAAIGKLPETLMDRSIVIPMQRKAPTEEVERFRLDRTDEFEPLRRKAARWAKDNLGTLRNADPDMPIGFGNRAADNIRNLLAIADAVGGHWPATARTAAAAIHRPDDDMSLGVMLLADVREIFKDEGIDNLRTTEILRRLIAMEDRPWPEYKNGKEITPPQLAKLLARYSIAPQNLRLPDGRVAKGYKLSSFQDAFERYLPPSPA